MTRPRAKRTLPLVVVSLRCPTCTAPVSLPEGARATRCPYCRTEIREVHGDATPPTPSGRALGESIAIRTPAGATIPILDAGTALPAIREEMLSTSKDAQPSIRCELVVIGSSTRPVAHLEVAIARAPRGVPKVPLVVRVAPDGEVYAALTSEGASANASFAVAVR